MGHPETMQRSFPPRLRVSAPGLEVQGNMMVVTIPYYCIQSADEIMLSADVNDPEDKTTLDFISFRDLSFTK